MNARLNLGIFMTLTAAVVLATASAPAKASTLDPLSARFLQGKEGAIDATVDAPSRDIRVDIWTDVPDEELMGRGEEYTLSFETNADLYVVIYRIDVEGRVEVLWPSSRYSDGFAYGNHVYDIPRPGQPGRLTVGSVKGVEYIEAIASRFPFDLRALGIDFRFDRDEPTRHDYYVDGDPFLAVNDINYAITGLEEDVDYVVTDWVHLYVEEQVEYARYACNQCHLDDTGHPTVRAYVDTCSRVEVRVDWGWYRNWYVSFGWYPLYYEPYSYWWDPWWGRPYWYAWYPVPYRWPAYSCYTRPYPIYWWSGSGYWRGDYRTQWEKRRTRSVPLYDIARTRSRTTTEVGPDGKRRTVTERPVSARGADYSRGRVDRDELAKNSRPPRQVDGPRGRNPDRGREVGAPRDTASRSGRGEIRTNRGPRERIVAQRPADGGRAREVRGRAPEARGGESNGRRWTRPQVQNDRRDRGVDRSSPRSSRGRSDDVLDRAPSSRDRGRGNVDRSRSGSGGRSRDVKPPSSSRGRGSGNGNVDRSRSGSGGRSRDVKPPSSSRGRGNTPGPGVDRSRSGSGGRDSAPRPSVDRSRSRGGGNKPAPRSGVSPSRGSRGGGGGSSVAPRSAPRPQPSPKPAPRSGGGRSRGRGGGGRG